MKRRFLPIAALGTLTLLSACIDIGGDDDDDDSESTEYYGYFLDSGVVGLSYSPNNGSDRTEGNGRFYYEPGQSTSFSVLGLNLGSASASKDNPVVTPATLLGEGSRTRDQMEDYLNDNSDNAQIIKNQLVLLQSLDYDQNPDNGINLPILLASEADSLLAPDLLSSLNLSASTSEFASALQAKLSELKTHGHVSFDTPVSEEAAVAHFLSTLEDLEPLTDYEGRWGMRSGKYGDLSAIYTFNDDLTIDLIEYDDCPSQLYGASEETLKSPNCTPVNISQTFSSNGTELILKNDNISDTCITLSSNSHEVFANCNFQGSGLGNEVIRLQRAPLAFNSNALHSQYTELEANLDSLTTFNFNTENNTGSYSGNENGNITWSFSTDGSVLNFTSSADNHNIDHNFTYKGFVKGSWLTGSSNVTHILRNPENTTTASLLNVSGFFGVFDITPGSPTEGECKEVRIVDYSNTNNNQVIYKSYNNASGNTYSCDYPADWDSLTPLKTETFNINSSYIENIVDTRRCYLLGIDDYEIDNLYVACEKSGSLGVFEIELWRGL